MDFVRHGSAENNDTGPAQETPAGDTAGGVETIDDYIHHAISTGNK
jgi:hypothetical protein